MTGESGESGSGYEHAGGYKPAWELPTLRDFIYPFIVIVILEAGNWLTDKYLGRHTPGHFFTLFAMLVGSIFMPVVVALPIIRGARPGAREGVADPVSGVDPQEGGADHARQRRENLLGGVFLIIVSLAAFAWALSELMNAGATP